MISQINKSQDELIGKVFFKKYTLVAKLGEGSFGMIYKATSPEGEYAMKFERRNKSNLLLETEAQILNYLRGPGVPLFKNFSINGNYNILIMQLLGKSLEEILHSSPKNHFSIRAVCNIGIQMIRIIHKIHDKHIIHRDIKPDNFVVGLGKESRSVYIIDFGLAKKYRSSTTLEQYPMKTGKKLTGTARYASINALSGLEQSRRDDLESIGYVLIYLLRGSLPWQGLPIKKKEDRYQKIMEKKKSTTPHELCRGFPKEFEEFMTYTRGLNYIEAPRYSYLIELLKKVLNQLGFEFDHFVDWEAPKQENGSTINNNITVVNTIYQQVNNITINNNNKNDTQLNNFGYSAAKKNQEEGGKNVYNTEAPKYINTSGNNLEKSGQYAFGENKK